MISFRLLGVYRFPVVLLQAVLCFVDSDRHIQCLGDAVALSLMQLNTSKVIILKIVTCCLGNVTTRGRWFDTSLCLGLSLGRAAMIHLTDLQHGNH
jgi:hypothetical protein